MRDLGPRSYKYEPTAWGADIFINHPDHIQNPTEFAERRITKLKDEVRALLLSTTNAAEMVNLIDTIEHLGLGYHFKREIANALSHLHDAKLDNWDLHHVATRFRLLRQHGFNVSSDVFLHFKDGMENFDEKLEKDAKGLLSLYNAGYLAIPGEIILDDAILYARGRLTLMVDDLKDPLKRRAVRALKSPLHKIITRVETRYFIEEYEEEESRNGILLELAKLDFNVLQCLHLKEMKELSLWWKGLNIGENLKYSRDRLLECYAFWAIGLYFEPEYSRARMMFAKILALLTIADDTFDLQGTLEDCKLLNEAVQRWDAKAVDILPMYLRSFYLGFINTINSFEDELEPSEKYRMPYLIQANQTLIEGYMKEIEWQAGGYVPSFEERKGPALFGSIGAIVLASPFVGVPRDIVTQELFQWFNTVPAVSVDCMNIVRYMDEFVTFERELSSGQGPTTIRCYMIEHNLKKEAAFVKFQSFWEDAWKRLNQACLRPTVAPMPVLERIINCSRVMQTLYLYFDDGFNKCSNVKEITARLLLKPFSL